MVSRFYLSAAAQATIAARSAEVRSANARRRADRAMVDSAFDSVAAGMEQRLESAAAKADRARFDEAASFGVSAYGEFK